MTCTSMASSGDTGGGDLMSDLANKLAMRRKGMSGAQSNQGGGTLGKMSMMIPALPDESEEEQDEQNDDWE